MLNEFDIDCDNDNDNDYSNLYDEGDNADEDARRIADEVAKTTYERDKMAAFAKYKHELVSLFQKGVFRYSRLKTAIGQLQNSTSPTETFLFARDVPKSDAAKRQLKYVKESLLVSLFTMFQCCQEGTRDSVVLIHEVVLAHNATSLHFDVEIK